MSEMTMTKLSRLSTRAVLPQPQHRHVDLG